MSKKQTVRNELSKYAQQIEFLAQEVQKKLSQGLDVIVLSNELVRNSSTFVFTLGEMYALESKGVGNAVKSTPSGLKNSTPRNYHNLRDASGRFVKV